MGEAGFKLACNDIRPKVLEAAEYIENGDPSKDVIDQWEVDVALCWLAELIKEGKADR